MSPTGNTYTGAGTPASYFWQAVVCVVLFPPTGIAAIVYSLLVTRRADIGDGAGAVRASQMARFWCIVTLGLCILSLVLSLALGLRR